MAIETWLEREEAAYPNGAMRRKGRALVKVNPHNPVALPYGKVRAVRAGIADSFFTVPARLIFKGKRIRGYLSYEGEGEDRALCFKPEANPGKCFICPEGTGCKKD